MYSVLWTTYGSFSILPVEIDLLVHQLDAVAGNAHHALDEGLFDIDGIAEHDDVAAVHILVGKQMFGDRRRPGAYASLSTSR